jgi:DNA-binding transcriptional LysR family regulator
MDIRQVDLNLLVIFDTMAKHRSVIRTAEAVGLSQPATSAALARLRTVFGDPLFVRGGTEMQPTPRALALAPAIHRVVETISLEVLQPAAFDPALAERSFTILTPDIGEISFIPGVLRHLRNAAPQVRLRTLSMPPKAAAEALESGQAELAVGFFPDLQKAGFFQQALFRTSYTCIACANRSGFGSNGGNATTRLSLKQFLAARHIVVRPDGRGHAFDLWLEGKGHRRQVTLELSHFMSLLAILPDSDLITTVPDDIAAAVARHIKVRRLELPFKPPVIEVQQYWHRRLQSDPANRWLRGVFHAVNRRDSS